MNAKALSAEAQQPQNPIMNRKFFFGFFIFTGVAMLVWYIYFSEFDIAKRYFYKQVESGQLTIEDALTFRSAVTKKIAEEHDDDFGSPSDYFQYDFEALQKAIALGSKNALLDLWFDYYPKNRRESLSLKIRDLLHDGHEDQRRVLLALGEAYYLGYGLHRSESDALKLFISAHFHGADDAKNYIEEIYNSHGCVDQAYIWRYLGGRGINARLIHQSFIGKEPDKARKILLQQRAVEIEKIRSTHEYPYDNMCPIDLAAFDRQK